MTKQIKLGSIPPERIIRADIMANIYNPDLFVQKRKLVVDLECGHKTIVSASRKFVVCPRCSEMFRRSLADGSEDWDAYRHGNKLDMMVWLKDPCRQFNEPTDLEGNFLYDSIE